MMSTKAGKRPLRSLTAHEKLEAIRRVHDGESKASVARDIGVPESTLRGWCKNEEKISYISRQSSPDTDDSLHAIYEPKDKKQKLNGDDIALSSPFNLSLKMANNNTVVTSQGQNLPAFPGIDADKPLNLNAKTQSALAASANTIMNNDTTKLSERERNRAELARLSIELGLNRPEMYPTNALADISSNIGILTQWNNLLMQQQKSLAAATTKKVTAPADSSTTASSLLTTTAAIAAAAAATSPYKTNTDTLPKVDPQKSVEESVWYWLKTQQAMLGLSQNNQSAPGLSNLASLANNATANAQDQNTSWFWKWYKQYTQVSQQLQQHQQIQQQSQPLQQTNDKNLLYQQLTKDKDSNSENVADPNQQMQLHHQQQQQQPQQQQQQHQQQNLQQPLQQQQQQQQQQQHQRPPSKITTNNNRARTVLDNLLLNNNNNVAATSPKKDAKCGDDVDDLTQSEALEHGEKFLKWLECCSEPSVTAMQIMQFRGLINNIKTGVDRRNGDVQKTKVRRK